MKEIRRILKEETAIPENIDKAMEDVLSGIFVIWNSFSCFWGDFVASPSAACARGTGRDGPGNSAFQYYCSSENLNAC